METKFETISRLTRKFMIRRTFFFCFVHHPAFLLALEGGKESEKNTLLDRRESEMPLHVHK